MEIVKDVYVPMADGVCLAVDLYRPDALTTHAAVVLVTPYRKDGTFDVPLGADGEQPVSLLQPVPEGLNPMLARVGGVFRWDNRIGWSVGMHERMAPIDPGRRDSPSFERKRAVYQERFDRYGERIAAGKSPANLDWLTEMYQHDAYDELWQARSF